MDRETEQISYFVQVPTLLCLLLICGQFSGSWLVKDTVIVKNVLHEHTYTVFEVIISSWKVEWIEEQIPVWSRKV